MAADTTEEEQIEAIKNWIEENGMSLVLTIVVVLGGTFGYRAWENSVRGTGEAASALYENLAQATTSPSGVISDELEATARSLGEQLKEEHENSTYAFFAALHLAKLAVG